MTYMLTKKKIKIKNQSLMLYQIYSKKIQIYIRRRFARCAASGLKKSHLSFFLNTTVKGANTQTDLPLFEIPTPFKEQGTRYGMSYRYSQQ